MKNARLRFILAALILLPSLGMLAQQPEASIHILRVFAYPDAFAYTSAQAINEKGDITGTYYDANGALRGFIRYRDGSFSPPIIAPNDTGESTQAEGACPALVNRGSNVIVDTFAMFFSVLSLYFCGCLQGALESEEYGVLDGAPLWPAWLRAWHSLPNTPLG